MKRTGAMFLVAILALALAAPAVAEAPANRPTGMSWSLAVDWLEALAADLRQAFGASGDGPTQTEAFPEIDPDGFTGEAFPEIDPDGASTEAFPEIDPDG